MYFVPRVTYQSLFGTGWAKCYYCIYCVVGTRRVRSIAKAYGFTILYQIPKTHASLLTPTRARHNSLPQQAMNLCQDRILTYLSVDSWCLQHGYNSTLACAWCHEVLLFLFTRKPHTSCNQISMVNVRHLPPTSQTNVVHFTFYPLPHPQLSTVVLKLHVCELRNFNKS